MGLRSRQRRLAGIERLDSYDVETSRYYTQSLQDHLEESRRDVDEFNLQWKNAVGIAGVVVILYEIVLLYHLMISPTSFLLKLIAMTSVLTTRQYVQTGRGIWYAASLFFISTHILIWSITVMILSMVLTMQTLSPVALIYCMMSHSALYCMGDNTKAEVARAKQLKKLEYIFEQEY